MFTYIQNAKEDYLYGNCNLFAVAAKELLNGNIVCLLENRLITTGTTPVVKEALIHCFVRVSDTHGFDAKGVRLIQDILDDYQFDCTELPSWLSENKTNQEVLGYGYQRTGGTEVIDLAIARQYIAENLMEDIRGVTDSSRKHHS